MAKPHYADTCNNNCTYLAELEARVKALADGYREAIATGDLPPHIEAGMESLLAGKDCATLPSDEDTSDEGHESGNPRGQR